MADLLPSMNYPYDCICFQVAKSTWQVYYSKITRRIEEDLGLRDSIN